VGIAGGAYLLAHRWSPSLHHDGTSVAGEARGKRYGRRLKGFHLDKGLQV
jgi:hypothetical protein